MKSNTTDKKFTKSKLFELNAFYFILFHYSNLYLFVFFCVRPLSQSENLAQLISKIDFTSEINDEPKDLTAAKSDLAQASKVSDKEDTISATKFYQNIYEKIK